jgi:hypothetical protein
VCGYRVGPDFDYDLASVRAVLNGIFQQVFQELADTYRVVDANQGAFSFHRTWMPVAVVARAQFPGEGHEVDLFTLGKELAFVGASSIKQFEYEGFEASSFAGYGADPFEIGGGTGVAGSAPIEKLGLGHECGEWRFEVVGGCREEVLLQPCYFFPGADASSFVDEGAALEDYGCLIGEESYEPDVFVGEEGCMSRICDKDTETPVLGRDRGSEEGARAL